jgi:hypothetical protein
VTTRFNENRETRVSKRTVQRSLYQEGYNRRVVKKKVRIREVNRKKRVKWAREKLDDLHIVYSEYVTGTETPGQIFLERGSAMTRATFVIF